jgi:integrase
MPKLIAVMSLRRIEALPPGHHAVAPGVYIAVSRTGGRSWFFRYRDGKVRHDIGLGSCSTASRDDAIREADKLRDQLRAGIDPLARKRERAIDRALSLTFEQCARRFYDANKAGWSPSHARAWLADLERDVLPVFGNMSVARVGVREVLAAIEPYWATKSETASRNRGRIEKVLDYAVAMQHRPDGKNPAVWKSGLGAILPPLRKVKDKTHLAALDWQQVPAFVAKLREREDIGARALEFAILTTSRSSEVRDMVWAEIDLERRVWTIPPARMKARKEHVVPLCARALAILQGLQRLDKLVFPIGRDVMIDIVKAVAGDYTMHGFRAAFSTWAGEATSLSRDVVERCLAHKTGNAVEQAYRRGQEIERRAQVLAAWERFVDEGVPEQQHVVVDMRRA